MRLADLAGRKAAILGFGREGRAAERLLRSRGIPPAAVYTGDVALPAGPHPGFHPGLPGADELREYDVVIRSPGISPYCEPLSSIAGTGTAVITGADIWFAEHPDALTVAVSGTKGKSTTASLIAHLARAGGLEASLGGNIGVPLLEMMAPEPTPDVWVIELSSFQLCDLRSRPSIAVVLNLFPEHLDWHGSAERYFADKLTLLEGMPEKSVIVNGADRRLREKLPDDREFVRFNDRSGIHVREDEIFDGDRRLLSLAGFPLPGAHNRSNLCAALSVLKVLGLDPVPAGDALQDFEALPHRLQTVGRIDGVEYVDDSISTTPQSTIAALECFPDRPVTVLVGGYDRGVEWSEFADFAARREGLSVVTFGAAGPRIGAAIRSIAPGALVREAENLEAAVAGAKELTGSGGVVLLSPGAPSFDAFRDYRERGERFAELTRRS